MCVPRPFDIEWVAFGTPAQLLYYVDNAFQDVSEQLQTSLYTVHFARI